ncbi:MAG: DUF1926 domain-containing protein [Termitinemataceae bacterium]|nr:MAG: DUF1926 domain-containing protein [Termitinemataceae bacterium]
MEKYIEKSNCLSLDSEHQLKIILGFHFHLPLGSSDADYENLYKTRIKILLAALFRYPKIPAVIHFSGNLLHYLERFHDELFPMIVDMIKVKQIELLSGGFFEPMMPLLQPLDRVNQIEMLTTYIRKSFNKRAYGCWIPDIAWDQNMPSVLSASNIAWTFLDSKRWDDASIKTLENCITEDKGKLVNVFPHAKNWRNLFETNETKDVIEQILKQYANKKTTFAIFPRTVFKANAEKELTIDDVLKFFDAICEYCGKIEWTIPGKVIKTNKSPNKIYFKQENVKQFLLDHSIANNIYARMIWNRSIVDMIKGDRIRKRRAQDKVGRGVVYNLFCNKEDYEEEIAVLNYSAVGTDWKLKNSCIEKPELRAAAFCSVLEADRIARELKSAVPVISQSDFLLCGIDDYIYQSELINCLIKSKGGCIFEMDYMPRLWNYLNTFNITNTRFAFTDIIAPTDFAEDDILNNSKTIRFCANEMYKLEEIERTHGKLKLKCAAKKNGVFNEIQVDKFYHIKQNTVNVYYEITNTSSNDLEFAFIPELNLSFSSDPQSKGKKALRLNYFKEFKSIDDHSEKHNFALDKKTITNINAINFEDMHNEVIIILHCESKFNASITHEKFEDTYQSTRILPQHNFKLSSTEKAQLKIHLSFYN